MTTTKATDSKKPKGPEMVDIVVVVNHDDLRRGEQGQVELTDTVRRRLDKGYLRLAEPHETEPGLPPVAALGAQAHRGAEPVVLLGVEPGGVVWPGDGGSSAQSGTNPA